MALSNVTKFDAAEYKKVMDMITDANEMLEAYYEKVEIKAENSDSTFTSMVIDMADRLRGLLEQYLNALTLTETNFYHIKENFQSLSDEELSNSIK